MIETLAAISLVLLLLALVLLVMLLRRPGADFSPALARIDTLEKLMDRSERAVKEEVARGRGESLEQSRALREELQGSLNVSTNNLDRIARYQKERFDDFASVQKQQLGEFAKSLVALTESSQKESKELRALVETKLTALQNDNMAKLEEMRRTVDEKLQGTLEKRLGESFKLVSDRLEAVHKGLGEMQNLATGVGDLKKVLTNVKTRGTWGEIQLGNLLEQMLTADQFERNVCVAGVGRAAVEFAIKLPGQGEEGKPLWLPIDAKFPKEDYERLVDAAERGDVIAVEQAAKDLDLRVRAQAKDIRDKYIVPPHTTDFGLLYLPTEGLYAEVLRRPGLVDTIQRDMRVVVVGPTTLSAVLNSLQMGFKTLVIQKRSSEVWKVLGAVKTEFGKFGEALDKVKKKLDEAGNVIEDASVRKRSVEKSLKQVEASPIANGSSISVEKGTPLLAFDSPVAGK